MTLRLRGRTTGNADEYAFYAGTRKSAEGAVTPVSIGEFGRQSAETTVELKFLVGTGTDHLAPESYWPDF